MAVVAMQSRPAYPRRVWGGSSVYGYDDCAHAAATMVKRIQACTRIWEGTACVGGSRDAFGRWAHR